MSRKFIAGVLAVSIAVAGFTAAPARAASDEDVAKFLGAAAALFIIGKAIESNNSNNKKKAKKEKHHNQQVHQPRKHVPTIAPRKKRHVQNAAPLPRRCVRDIQGNNHRNVLPQRCLSRHYHSAKPLPRACRITVNTNRGHRPAYGLRCLKNRGYQLARR